MAAAGSEHRQLSAAARLRAAELLHRRCVPQPAGQIPRRGPASGRPGTDQSLGQLAAVAGPGLAALTDQPGRSCSRASNTPTTCAAPRTTALTASTAPTTAGARPTGGWPPLTP